MHMKIVVTCAIFISLIMLIYLFLYFQYKEINFFRNHSFIQSLFKFLMTGLIIFSTPLLFLIIILLLFIGIGEILPVDFNLKNSGDATLLAAVFAGSITLISIIVSALVKAHSKKQDRIANVRSEMSWRKELVEIEVKSRLRINDVLKLNSFINPYHKEKTIDYFINKVCTRIVRKHLLNHYNNENENKKIKRNLKEFQKIKNEVKKYSGILPPEAIEKHDETIFDLKIDSIITEKLNSNESQVIRECVHALLKNDWEYNVK